MKWLVIRTELGIEVAQTRFYKPNDGDDYIAACTRPNNKIMLLRQSDIIDEFEHEEKALKAKEHGEFVEKELRDYYFIALSAMNEIRAKINDKVDKAIKSYGG